MSSVGCMAVDLRQTGSSSFYVVASCIFPCCVVKLDFYVVELMPSTRSITTAKRTADAAALRLRREKPALCHIGCSVDRTPTNTRAATFHYSKFGVFFGVIFVFYTHQNNFGWSERLAEERCQTPPSPPRERLHMALAMGVCASVQEFRESARRSPFTKRSATTASVAALPTYL